jgi:hypothetical protein
MLNGSTPNGKTITQNPLLTRPQKEIITEAVTSSQKAYEEKLAALLKTTNEIKGLKRQRKQLEAELNQIKGISTAYGEVIKYFDLKEAAVKEAEELAAKEIAEEVTKDVIKDRVNNGGSEKLFKDAVSKAAGAESKKN